MNLFRRARETSPAEATKQLKAVAAMLVNRRTDMQHRVEEHALAAKAALARGDRKTALICVRRKKTCEQRIDKLFGTESAIDDQINAIEGAITTKQAVDAMRIGAEAMRPFSSDRAIDEAEEVAEEVRDQIAVSNEISDVISAGFGTEDDSTILEELAQLEEEIAVETMTVQHTQIPVVEKMTSTTLKTKPNKERIAIAL